MRIILRIIVLGVIVYLFYRNFHDKSDQQVDSQTTAPETELVILSVNDIHANIDMFPKFATMVDSLRSIYPDMLLFSAGDNRTGNPVNDQYDPVNYPMIE